MQINLSYISSCAFSTGSVDKDGDDEEEEFEEEFPLSSFLKTEKSEDSDDDGVSEIKNEFHMKIDSNGNKIGIKCNGGTTLTSTSSSSQGEIKVEGSVGFDKVHIDFSKSADASGSRTGIGAGGLMTSGSLGVSELTR